MGLSQNAKIHPTAIVHPGAELGEATTVGSYSIIGENIVTGKNCEIGEHVVIRGITRLGDGVRIYPFATLGADPQHLNYKGEPTRVEIGNRVVIREGVTIHRGTRFGNHVTVVKDDAYLMAYCHVAHDCVVGKKAILTNAVLLAGHVTVDDYAFIGGMTGIAQFCRVGKYCFTAGGSILRKDLPPFLMGKGNDFEVQGVNIVGLARHGFSGATIGRLKKLYKIFYHQNLTVSQALAKIDDELGPSDEVRVFVDFVKETKVGFIR